LSSQLRILLLCYKQFIVHSFKPKHLLDGVGMGSDHPVCNESSDFVEIARLELASLSDYSHHAYPKALSPFKNSAPPSHLAYLESTK